MQDYIGTIQPSLRLPINLPNKHVVLLNICEPLYFHKKKFLLKIYEKRLSFSKGRFDLYVLDHVLYTSYHWVCCITIVFCNVVCSLCQQLGLFALRIIGHIIFCLKFWNTTILSCLCIVSTAPSVKRQNSSSFASWVPSAKIMHMEALWGQKDVTFSASLKRLFPAFAIPILNLPDTKGGENPSFRYFSWILHPRGGEDGMTGRNKSHVRSEQWHHCVPR